MGTNSSPCLRERLPCPAPCMMGLSNTVSTEILPELLRSTQTGLELDTVEGQKKECEHKDVSRPMGTVDFAFRIFKYHILTTLNRFYYSNGFPKSLVLESFSYPTH